MSDAPSPAEEEIECATMDLIRGGTATLHDVRMAIRSAIGAARALEAAQVATADMLVSDARVEITELRQRAERAETLADGLRERTIKQERELVAAMEVIRKIPAVTKHGHPRFATDSISCPPNCLKCAALAFLKEKP